MGQVAFDTLQASEELETAGISREQARAISLVVRRSHEVADLATKRDVEDVRKDLKAVIQNHDAQLPICFEKTESKIMDVRKDFTIQITDVRRDMDTRFEKTDAQIADARKDLTFQITDVRKDLQLEMASIRSEQQLIRWMLGALIAGMLSLIIKAFFVAVA